MVFLYACLSCACLWIVVERERFTKYNGQMWGRRSLFSSFSFLLLLLVDVLLLAFYSFDLCLDQPTLKPKKEIIKTNENEVVRLYR